MDVLAVFDWMKIEHWSYLFGLFSVGYRGIHQMFASAISDGVGKIDTMTLQFVFISEMEIPIDSRVIEKAHRLLCIVNSAL